MLPKGSHPSEQVMVLFCSMTFRLMSTALISHLGRSDDSSGETFVFLEIAFMNRDTMDNSDVPQRLVIYEGSIIPGGHQVHLNGPEYGMDRVSHVVQPSCRSRTHVG